MVQGNVKEAGYVRAILTASMLISIALVTIETIRYPPSIVMDLFLILLLAASFPLISVFQRKGMKLGWFISLAMLNLFLVVPEYALRVARFQYESGMQFGYPRPSEFVRLTWDEDLFWRLDPSLPAVNSLGFPGDEFQIPKPDGVYRILYLGDSCTQQGYPEIVEGMLNEQRPQEGIIIESVSLAVPGYTSHQGRILAEQLGQSVDPNLVVVYFGWNDHWLAFDSKDSEKQLDTSGATRLYYDLQRYRLAQFLFWISDTVLKVRSVPIEEVRVPKQEYNENLSRIVGTFHSRDVPVILITAPTSHYRLGVPDYLVELHFVEDKAAAVELHREYNVAVRDFSDTEALYLLDLEREFNELTTDEMSRIFMADGIHFTPYGLEEVAARLTEFINNNIFQTTMP